MTTSSLEAVKCLGEGWVPLSTTQQHRLLYLGPLYDPKTLPVIPSPYLVDIIEPQKSSEELQTSLPSSAGDNAEDDIPKFHAVPYRIATPVKEKDECDDLACAPLPPNFCYSLDDLAAPLLKAVNATSSVEKKPDEFVQTSSSLTLASSLHLDDELHDLAVAHQTVVDMFRLGKPGEWSDGAFSDEVEFVRHVLERQRTLFPTTAVSSSQPSLQASLSLSSKSATPKKSTPTLSKSASTVAQKEADDADKGKISVDNPLVTVLQYKRPMTQVAKTLIGPSLERLIKPDNATATEAAVSSSVAREEVAVDENDDEVDAGSIDAGQTRAVAWSYEDDYVPNVQSILKKIELLRKKQQLFVGFGRSVAIAPAEHLLVKPSRKASTPTQPPPSGAAGKLLVESESNNKDLWYSTAKPTFRVSVRKLPTQAGSLASQASLRLESSKSIGMDEGAEPSGSMEIDNAHEESFDVESATDGSTTQGPLSGSVSFAAAPSSSSFAVPISDVDPSVRVVSVKSCGDPKAMSILDKCEWDKEPLKDDFDLVYGGLQPTKLLDTNPLDWLNLVKADVTRGGSDGKFAQILSVESASRATAQPQRTSDPSSIKKAQNSQGINQQVRAEVTNEDTEGEEVHVPTQISRSASAARHSLSEGKPQQQEAIPPALPQSTSAVVAHPSKETLPPKSGGKDELPPLAACPNPPKDAVDAPPPSAPLDSIENNTPPVKGPQRVLSAMLFGNKKAEATLPHNLPPLTIVFSPFHVQSFIAEAIASDDDDADPMSRLRVEFSQLRPFYLRPPRDPTGDDDEDVDEDADEFWDDAVENIQQDMDDECLVPPTPPTTPMRWSAPVEKHFVPAPFTQMLIDRLEAGIESRPRTPDESSEDEEPSQAVTQSTGSEPAKEARKKSTVAEGDDAVPEVTEQNMKNMEEAHNEAMKRMEAERAKRLEAIRQQNGGEGWDDAAERTMQRFTAPSRSNKPLKSEPRLILTRPPLRQEGTVSVVKRIMRRSKKEIMALSKKSKEAQLVSFRPSRRFLAEIMRLRPFGSLMVALLTNPDDPLPDDSAIRVPLLALGDRLDTLWQRSVREAEPSPPTAISDDAGRGVDTLIDPLISVTASMNVNDATRLFWEAMRQELSSIHRTVRQDAGRRKRASKTPSGVRWSDVVALTALPSDSISEDAPLTRNAPKSSSSSVAKVRGRMAINHLVDERTVIKDAPYFPHFLPRPSTVNGAAIDVSMRTDRLSSTPLLPLRGKTPTGHVLSASSVTLANLRRVPRGIDQRGGIDPSYHTIAITATHNNAEDDTTTIAFKLPPTFDREVGAEASRKQFSALRNASLVQPKPTLVVSNKKQAGLKVTDAPSTLKSGLNPHGRLVALPEIIESRGASGNSRPASMQKGRDEKDALKRRLRNTWEAQLGALKALEEQRFATVFHQTTGLAVDQPPPAGQILFESQEVSDEDL